MATAKAPTKKAGKKTAKKAAKKTAKKAASKKTAKKTASKGADKAAAGKSATEADATKAVGRNESAKKRQDDAKKAADKSRNYAASGLAGQLTEGLIDEIRSLDKPWHQTTEAQQAVVIARLSDRVADAMGEAVQVLAAVGHKAVICTLMSVTFKEGVRAIVNVPPGSDKRLAHALADHATKEVVLVMADPSQFMQGLEDLKPDADQPKLI